MRSLTGDDAFGRQRPADFDAPRTTSAQSSHMSFILADEATLDSYLEQPSIPRPRDPWKAHEAGHILSARRDDKDVEPSRTAPVERSWAPAPEPSVGSRASAVPPSPASVRSHNTQMSWSRPVTPIMLGTSVAGSIMSSPSSRRGSLCGSISEHAISSDDEDDFPQETPSASLGAGNAPQLVMPSIKMPSRRPFTEAGKAMGRLKVLVAGDSGVGKTALIKAVVQSCEHIVHVDPITPQPSKRSPKSAERDVGPSRRDFQSTSGITEILASTKPYPQWWTELDEATASQRRRSTGDSILERNICFVDTPGYGKGSSALETMIPCVEYVESHLNRLSADALSNPEMLNLLGGGGGFQVDAVLYMINGGLKPVDIEYLRRLAPLTNIIPLLAQADTRTTADIDSCKRRISSQLQEAGIRPFVFSGPSSGSPFSRVPDVFAVSSANGSDHDIMDASLLMSPDYVQPLAPTDLEALVRRVFTPNGSSWLRHSAVKKYLQWRDATNPSRPRHLYRPLSLQPGPSTALARIPAGSYALARIHNEPREKAQPQFRLVDWAAELQRSMASERAQYEALERGERAVWLTEKLNECVKDGTLVPVSAPQAKSGLKKRRVSRQGFSQKTMRHQDPLGLLQVAADLKAKGWATLELLGSLGLIGGVVYWLTRQRWQMEPACLTDEWTRLLGLGV